MRWMAAGAIRWFFVFFSHLQDWRRRSLDRAGSCWRRLPGLGLHGDAGRGWCDSVDLTWASLTPANPSADRDHAPVQQLDVDELARETTGFVPVWTKSWDQEIVDPLDQPRPLLFRCGNPCGWIWANLGTRGVGTPRAVVWCGSRRWLTTGTPLVSSARRRRPAGSHSPAWRHGPR